MCGVGTDMQCGAENDDGGVEGCPKDWVCPNGGRTGRVGHVQSWWGHTQQVPEVGR